MGSAANILYILESKGKITLRELHELIPDMSLGALKTAVHRMERAGKVHYAGHGMYEIGKKLEYVPQATPWMKEIGGYMFANLVGVDYCICERGDNIYLDVYKPDIERTYSVLKRKYANVVMFKDVKKQLDLQNGEIIVGQLYTGSPFLIESEIVVPSLEKTLVDEACMARKSKGFNLQKSFQRAFETYSVNVDRLRRYASRRNVCGVVDALIASIDSGRVNTIARLQDVLSDSPVTRAWVFGSFARGEEREDSDIDLLVDINDSAEFSLLDHTRLKSRLSKALSREVDFVVNGSLMPFAVESVENDKYLIYERSR